MSNSIRNVLIQMILGGLACCLVGGNALAHIKNEASQFPDIEYSDARFDIVVLVGIGVIPETPVFEPDKPLSRKELATWAALSARADGGGETPDVTRLANSAVEMGLVGSLDGDATLAELSQAIFGGTVTVADGGQVPSKAEAATFIAQQLDTDAGASLMQRKKIQAGETGAISGVELGDSHHGFATYTITIDGVSRAMTAHGRVANGPVDLLQWQGRIVGRSFVKGSDEAASWIFLEAEIPAAAVDEVAASLPAAVPVANDQELAPRSSDRRLLYGLILAVVAIGLLLFFRRRRQG